MRHYSEFGFADPETVRNYAAGGPAFFVPGFSVMHQLTLQLIRETTPADGEILVLGAGGGHEVNAFAAAEPGWRIAAVDPSPQMIEAARAALAERAARVSWTEGYISDAPAGPFDAATCLLTLHLIPDDGAKLKTLRAIRARLKQGGLFAVVDNCFDRNAPEFAAALERLMTHAERSGVPKEVLERVRVDLASKSESVTAEREVELLGQAGFSEIQLYYAGLSWRGWSARA